MEAKESVQVGDEEVITSTLRLTVINGTSEQVNADGESSSNSPFVDEQVVDSDEIRDIGLLGRVQGSIFFSIDATLLDS